MTSNFDSTLKALAKAKLERLQNSPKYRSFLSTAAIDAFSKIEGSAFAGKSIKRTDTDDMSPRC